MTQWGTDNEAAAINEYEVESGSLVMPAPFVEFEDWSGCTPDGYIEDYGMIEVKCPFSQKIYEAWPEYYRAQVIGQLGITGMDWCDCWCWTPGGWKVVERIQYSSEDWAHMLKELRAFFKHVTDDVEPKRKAKYQFNNAALMATQI